MKNLALIASLLILSSTTFANENYTVLSTETICEPAGTICGTIDISDLEVE